jgi:predicted RNase H-like HicB family nuclease
MNKKLTFSSIAWKEGDMYVSRCPDLDIASQGKNIEEVLNHLKETIALEDDAQVPFEKFSPILAAESVETRERASTTVKPPSS